MKYLFLLFLLVSSGLVSAQTVISLEEVTPKEAFENVKVEKLNTDPRSTSFVIWVKNGVKAHYHAEHSETLYVLEGTAEMTMGEKTFTIKAGDYIHIPKGIVHSVKVTSDIPVKVLSIQAPEFLGTDRIFVDQ